MQKTNLEQSVIDFNKSKKQQHLHTAQRIALQLIAQIDIQKIETASLEAQTLATRKIKRLIERERLKGNACHWSYDLNRHIALKQALDRIQNIVYEKEKIQ